MPTLAFANEKQLTVSQDHSGLAVTRAFPSGVGLVYLGRDLSSTAAPFTLLCSLAAVDLAIASAATAVDDANSTIGHSE